MIAALDPIRPYLWLAKWLGLAVVVSVLFVGGCRHGERRQAEKDNAVILKAQREAATMAETLRQIDADTQAMAREAADRVEQAKAAEARAIEGARTLRADLAEVNREIAEAKRDPDCKRLMETKSCALLK